MKRHAYLILAYHQFDFLRELVRALDDPRHDLFIHVDAKSRAFTPSLLDGAARHSKLTFVDRLQTNWGAYSLIEAEMRLLAAATPNHYSFYHLLSGADLPIQSNDARYAFFEAHPQNEFVNFWGEELQPKMDKRVKFYRFFQEHMEQMNWQRRFWRTCERIHLAVQGHILHTNRWKDVPEKVYMGSQWFSITDAFAQYAVAKRAWVEEHFSRTICPDEVVFQTLVGNSPFMKNVYSRDDAKGPETAMRLVDWKRGDPYVFRLEDFKELMTSPCMFARKFEMKEDPAIIQKVLEAIRQK